MWKSQTSKSLIIKIEQKYENIITLYNKEVNEVTAEKRRKVNIKTKIKDSDRKFDSRIADIVKELDFIDT